MEKLFIFQKITEYVGGEKMEKLMLTSDGRDTAEDVVKIIKFNISQLMTNFRNDEGSASFISRIDLIRKTKNLIREAIVNGIEDPEVFRAAKVLGFENIAN